MLAAKWFDMVVGVDIHIVMVPVPPAPPIPTPLPHPFIGLVFDPAGLAVGAAISAGISAVTGAPFAGPVLINSLPTANTGTEGTNKLVMPHFPMPPGVAWAPIPAAPPPPVPGKPPDPPVPTPVPSNDTILITGSKTVHIGGTNQCRLGDMAMDCAEPIRIPNGAVIAIPMGPPVLVGGPPALDLLAALMGSIRTKWVTGRLRRLTGAFEGSWRARLICMLTGHPVDVASGMVLTDAVDLELPGPVPFKVERTYFSKASETNGPLGHGWAFSCDEFVRIEDQRISLRAGDGRELFFDPVAPGGSTRNDSEGMTLQRGEDEVHIQRGELLTYVYGPVGRADGTWPLLSIEDRRGNRIRFVYDRLGRLCEAVDSAGRLIRFDLDAAGRITAISVPHPELPEARIDCVRYEYDEAGDLVAAYDALNNPYRYAYKHHLLVQETNRNGLSFYFAYDGITSSARCVRTWGDGGIFDHVLTYDSANHLTVKEDSHGARTIYHSNEAGLVEKIVDSLGRERTFEYDHGLRTVCETDPTGAALEMEYDERGDITSIRDADGVTREYEYDHLGQPTRERFGGFEYVHRYNEFGELVDSANPVGGGVRQEFAANGDLIRAETRGGKRIEFEWGAQRNLVGVTVSGEGTTMAKFDALGRCNHISLPDGTGVDFTLDLNGRPTEVSYSWLDAPDSYFYDAEGLLVRSSRAGNAEIRYEHGNYNKTTAIHDERGTQRFEYDLEGSLIAVVNAKGERWEIRRNSEGEAIAETDFSGRTTEYVLDPAGRISEVCTASGRRQKWEWTPGGRIASISYEDGSFDKYSYDSRGLVIKAENEAGTLDRELDPTGQMTREAWNGTGVEYEYDLDGLRTGMSTSDGFRATYQYDAGERPTAISVNGGKTVSWRYDRVGRPTEVRMPGGVTLRRRYDGGAPESDRVTLPDGSLAAYRVYEFTPGRALSAVADSRRGIKSFAHGPHGLETVFRDGEPAEQFKYDLAGELLPVDGPTELGPGGRLRRFGSVAYEYDEEGRVTRRTVGDTTWDFTYNDRGQLTAAENGTGRSVRYEYDPLGRRVTKQNGSERVRWTWDENRPLAEITESETGSEIRRWVFEPESYQPLLVVKDGRCYNVITDSGGTPQEVFSEDGDLAWAGDYRAWGGLQRTVDGGFDNPLRYSGQWFDRETGLHYNWHRYYDPETARYLTPDPIGLRGGLRSYAYPSAPFDFTDPDGLGCVRRFFSSYMIFLRSGIRPKHARAIMRQAMETGQTFAFRNIGDDAGAFSRFTKRIGSMIEGMRGMRPKPLPVKDKSNWRGVATAGEKSAADVQGQRFRSDYDPAYFLDDSGRIMSNAEADDANKALNQAIGGDEIQHPTHLTMGEVLPPEKVQDIGPPGNVTEFRPDGTTRQVTPEQMQSEHPGNWPW